MKRKELAKKLGMVTLAFVMTVPFAVPAVCYSDTPVQAEADTSSKDHSAGEKQNEMTFQSKTYEKTYKTEDGRICKEVSFAYPYAQGDSQAAQAFNQFYQKLLTKWKKAAKKNLDDAKEYAEQREDIDNDSYYGDSVTYKITSKDNKYISVLQSGYEYTGGAHGMPYRDAYVFDAKTGKKVSAASMLGISKSQLNKKVRDLFLKKYDKTTKEKISLFYEDRNDVKAFLEKMDFNQNLYYLKNGKLRFYADPYAVGPYASGFIEVSVKLS